MLRLAESKPVRRNLTSANEDAGVVSTSNMTVVRVTPQQGPPLNCVWEVRWIFATLNPITLPFVAKNSVLFVGNPVPLMDQLMTGNNDLSKVMDAVDNFTKSTESHNYDDGEITIMPGDVLYYGMFGPGLGANLIVNAGIDEWQTPAYVARRM